MGKHFASGPLRPCLIFLQMILVCECETVFPEVCENYGDMMGCTEGEIRVFFIQLSESLW